MINNQMQDYRSLIDKTSADVLSGVGFGTDGQCNVSFCEKRCLYENFCALSHHIVSRQCLEANSSRNVMAGHRSVDDGTVTDCWLLL